MKNAVFTVVGLCIYFAVFTVLFIPVKILFFVLTMIFKEEFQKTGVKR